MSKLYSISTQKGLLCKSKHNVNYVIGFHAKDDANKIIESMKRPNIVINFSDRIKQCSADNSSTYLADTQTLLEFSKSKIAYNDDTYDLSKSYVTEINEYEFLEYPKKHNIGILMPLYSEDYENNSKIMYRCILISPPFHVDIETFRKSLLG